MPENIRILSLRGVGWIMIAAVAAVIAFDGIRYFRVKGALEAGVNTTAATLGSRNDLLESFVSAKRLGDSDNWPELQQFERVAIEAGVGAAVQTGVVTDVRTNSRAQLASFVTSSPFWKEGRRKTEGVAIVRPGECTNSEDVHLSSCRFARVQDKKPFATADHNVTVVMGARFRWLVPLYPTIGIQASQTVRVQ